MNAKGTSNIIPYTKSFGSSLDMFSNDVTLILFSAKLTFSLISKFGKNWITLISASKAFSFPGPRCGLAIISPELNEQEFEQLGIFVVEKDSDMLFH